KLMFGSGKYSAPSRDDILETVRERSEPPVFPGVPEAKTAFSDSFLDVLASSLELWESLMVRCLALAEYVWWALYGRGLGMAAKFEVNVKEGHNPSDDEARSGG
ncbi:MAG TPA: hypothetical protein VKA15_12790, partial [Isosphaeraceae bacterium]|nr:hypothetical protein [Isosphaeraceae bacterium]